MSNINSPVAGVIHILFKLFLHNTGRWKFTRFYVLSETCINIIINIFILHLVELYKKLEKKNRTSVVIEFKNEVSWPWNTENGKIF